MKLTAMMAMAAVMGTAAWAGERDLTNERKVIVCMEPGTDIFATLRAQTVASKIFAELW